LQCARRLGHDISEFLRSDLTRHGIEFVPDIAQVGTGVVDVAICHHALEHVLDPAAILLEISRVLRSGGTLLVAVPFEKERRYRRYRSHEPNHHLYSWNPQTLGNLVTETGYVLDSVQLGEFGYDRFAAVWGQRLRLGERGFGLVRRMAHLLQPGREVSLTAHTPTRSSNLPVDAPRATEENKGHGQDEARPDFRL
jgi:SAM-dependent methyltransferase